jgi:hypothetical protein
MGERLVRMEALLQRLAEAKDDGTNDLHSRILDNLEKSVCFDVVHDPDGHTEPRGDAPIWSLFDNTVVSLPISLVCHHLSENCFILQVARIYILRTV